MTEMPQISVVMAVYNGADTLPATLDSILSQQGVDLEFIVVNDGSTDETGHILARYSNRDTRLRVFEQENQGLTRSLIRGCAEARGEFIARQDCGDVSLPGRLQSEISYFRSREGLSMVSCGTQFIGPHREVIQTVVQSEREAKTGLTQLTLEKIQGPSHHGSVMFRKEIYRKVGGYRPQFRVAQDLDLWLRLVEYGNHGVVEDILYQAALDPFSISSRSRDQQVLTAGLILEGARLRKLGKNEDHILQQAGQIPLSSVKYDNQEREPQFYYFLGCCLNRTNPAAAEKYFRAALKANPLFLKAGLRLLQYKLFS